MSTINRVEKVNLATLEAGDKVKCWCGKCMEFRMHTVKAKSLVPGKSPKSICITWVTFKITLNKFF